MCGRYASTRGPAALVEEFRVEENQVAETLEADYNVAPTKPVYAVLQRPRKQDDAGGEVPARRQLRVLTWGLVPSWAEDPKIGSRMINARMETVATKPAYRKAFAARRCLLPADGFYEWYPTPEAASGRRKQPFFIRPRDQGVMAMAGLYEIWRDPQAAPDDPARFRWTCTVITTRAEDSLGHIHERMPLVLEPDRWDRWLDTGTEAGPDLLDLLQPPEPGSFEAFPVAPLVNNVRNNGPELVRPLPLEGADGEESVEEAGS